jgi:hypothetical protein
MLFKEIIAVYIENCMKPIHTLRGENAELKKTKAGFIYNCHLALKY